MWFDERWFLVKWDKAFGRAESIQKIQIFTLYFQASVMEFWGKCQICNAWYNGESKTQKPKL